MFIRFIKTKGDSIRFVVEGIVDDYIYTPARVPVPIEGDEDEA